MTDEKLTPERAVRLLRATAEGLQSREDKNFDTDVLALIAALLADHIELNDASRRLYEAHTENLIERMARVEQHLWPEEWKDYV